MSKQRLAERLFQGCPPEWKNHAGIFPYSESFLKIISGTAVMTDMISHQKPGV